MDIAFCINLTAFRGLGPTLSSLIQNSSEPNRLNIWLLCSGINRVDKQAVQELLQRENFEGLCQFIDFDPRPEFGKFDPLHGDWTAYGRLMLADLLDIDTVLYLDADLIVEIDILKLDDWDMRGNAIAAVAANTIRHALDHPFLNGKLGIPLDTSYFNSGVLFLDLKKWREENYKQECLCLATKYPTDLISHDQSLLNAVFGKRFTNLPKEFNSPWYAFSPRPTVADKMILHFLGLPKPWDMGGRLMHNAYATWKKHEDKEWARQYHRLTLDSIFRAWNIRRSNIRMLKKKLNI